jgi:DNA-binding transcriptional LysR family regulator
MEIHQMRYALAVADSGSFTAAAAQLHVCQSGVSTQVRKLERELGVPLFVRGSRGSALTREGERLLPALRAAAAAVDEVHVAASDLRGMVVGSLRIGTVTALGWPAFFDAVAAIHAAHPGVDLRLVESTSSDLVDRVRRGELDVAVAAWSHEAPVGLTSVTVLDDALVAVVAPGHPWAARGVVGVGELGRAELIAFPPGTGARDAMDQMFARAGLSATPRWEAASPTSLTALAARAVGVAVASETTVADTDDLVVLRIDDPEARSRLGTIWRTEATSATHAFLAELFDPGRTGDPRRT